MATTKTRKKPVYRPVLKLPPLPHEQFAALRDNIAVNGILVPIIVDSDGATRRVIDGNYRKAIAHELGYDCPEIVQPNLDEDEKRTLARALNLARRQLNQEQRRELIADQLGETPERSNRWIGKQLGVEHATVAAVRRNLESTGEIPQLDRTVGLDGKFRSRFHAKDNHQIRQCWKTDPALFASLHKVFRFTVDACADAGNALLPRYWTDAARKDWRGERVFCNPPFAGLAPILAKAPTAQICVLVYMLNALTARYFHRDPADYLLLPPRRLKFIPPEDIEERDVNFGTCLLFYGRMTAAQRKQLENDWLIYRL